MEDTLEDFGISMGQVIYVEFSNANNQWPSDKLSEAKAATPTPKTEKSD